MKKSLLTIGLAAGYYAACKVDVTDLKFYKREATTRLQAARHVLEGKPLVFRMLLTPPPPPPVLSVAAGLADVLIIETTADSTPIGGGTNFHFGGLS